MNRKLEKIVMWIAWHLPKPIAYWATIRLATSNGEGKTYEFNPADRTMGDVLKSHENWVR